MIVQLLLELIFGFVKTLINLIPTLSVPVGFSAAVTDVTYLISIVAYFLPLGTITICLSLIFVIQNAKLFISLFNFVIRKIPGIS